MFCSGVGAQKTCSGLPRSTLCLPKGSACDQLQAPKQSLPWRVLAQGGFVLLMEGESGPLGCTELLLGIAPRPAPSPL